MGCHFLLQEIFPTQGSNPSLLGLLLQQVDYLPLAPPGKLNYSTWYVIAYKYSVPIYIYPHTQLYIYDFILYIKYAHKITVFLIMFYTKKKLFAHIPREQHFLISWSIIFSDSWMNPANINRRREISPSTSSTSRRRPSREWKVHLHKSRPHPSSCLHQAFQLPHCRRGPWFPQWLPRGCEGLQSGEEDSLRMRIRRFISCRAFRREQSVVSQESSTTRLSPTCGEVQRDGLGSPDA